MGKFKATRESCVLSSYIYLLNIATKQYKDGDLPISAKSIFQQYVIFYRNLRPTLQSGKDLTKWLQTWNNMWYIHYNKECEKIEKLYYPTSSISNITGQTLEFLTSIMLHFYCIEEMKNISGYQHLEEFHNYLMQNNILDTSDAVVVDTKKYGSSETIENCRLIDLLQQKKDSLLLALYKHDGYGNHSIVIGCDNNQFFKIDPNVGRREKYKWDNEIKEYIQFNVIGR